MTGQELQDMRKRAGLSQAELGTMLGIHPKSVAYWESKKAEEVRPRDTGTDTLGTVTQTLRQIQTIKGTDFADPDQAMPSPFDMGDIIRRGDLLLLSEREAAAGDIMVEFNLGGKAELLGRVYPTESGGLAMLDHMGRICVLPDREAYRVIAYHIRSGAGTGGQ